MGIRRTFQAACSLLVADGISSQQQELTKPVITTAESLNVFAERNVKEVGAFREEFRQPTAAYSILRLPERLR